MEVVQELLKDKRVDPSANNNYAIRWASEKGHLEVVQELLKDNRVDPSELTMMQFNWQVRMDIWKLLKNSSKIIE